MVEAILDIKRWGNSLGVRLLAPVAREARLPVCAESLVIHGGDG